MQKTQIKNSELTKENPLKKEESEKEKSESEDTLIKPEDNTRYGDWVKNGRTIDF
jgi:hypothetical protein